MNRFSTASILLLVCACAARADATPAGKLDSSFGNGGRRVVAFDAGGDLADRVNDTVLAPDGSIYLVGEAQIDAGTRMGIAIARLDANGTPDADFGKIVYLGSEFFSMRAFGAAVQDDGKLLVAGQSRDSGLFVFDGFVCRFDTDGSIDESFGTPQTPGCAVLFKGSIFGMRVQNNGDLLFAGELDVVGPNRAAVMRTDANGIPDDGFGVGGIATRNASSSFSDVAQASDGTLIAVGTDSTDFSQRKMLLAAFESNGDADFDFSDSGGVFSIPAGANRLFFGAAVEVASDGSYVITGSFEIEDDGGMRAAVLRLLPNGNAFPGFGIGIRVYDPCETLPTTCDMRAEDVHVLPDGRITVVGSIGDGDDPSSADFYALRLAANGDPDASFGAQDPDAPGKAYIGFNLEGGDSRDAAAAVVAQGERLLIAGDVKSTKSAGDVDFAIVRLDDGLSIFADGLEND